jgi:hypothetical protein
VLEVGAVALAGDAVDRAQQLERFDQRQIPVQLRALAEDHADRARVAAPLFVGYEARDADHPGSRHEDPRQHLDRGRLPGAVGTDVADQFARVKRHRDALDRDLVLVVAREQRTQRAGDARLPHQRAEDFPQIARFDDRHRPVRFGARHPDHARLGAR